MRKALLIASFFLSHLLFAQSTPFLLNGSATPFTGTPPYPNYSGCGCYQITPDQTNKAGAVYNNTQIDLTQPFDFNFWVYFGCHNENTANFLNQNSGADGMGFVLTRNVTALGSSGGNMGFGYLPHSSDGGQSLDIEYDIFSNPKSFANGGHFDPPYPAAITQYEGNEVDHMALDIDAAIDHWPGNPPAVQASATDKNIEDCSWHTTRIVWDPATQNLTAYFDGVQRFSYTFSSNVVSTYFVNNPMVNWGWTGATGAKYNEQRVCMNFTPNFVVVNGNNKKVCSNVVQFQDSSTSSLNKIIGWDWNFGDGSPNANTSNPLHTFPGAGSYTVTLTITDQSGCQASKSYVVQVAPITIAGTVQNVTCPGGNDGGVNITVSGGSGTYTNYDWSNNTTNQNLSNVIAGTYTVTVKDNTGCSNTNSFTITGPAALGGSIGSKTDVTCFGQSTGAATINATGGNGNYTVNWSPGGKTGLSVTGLSAGNYTATLSQTGCTQTVAIPVTINGPASGISVTSQTTSASCTGGGTATLTASGGQGTLTVLWGDGNTSFSRTNIAGGKYYFTISDASGCTHDDSVTVPLNVTALTYTVAKEDPNCSNGLSAGKIKYTITSGTPNYTFQWSANANSTTDSAVNLPSGNYATTITDGLGCSVTNTVTINPPVQALSFTISKKDKRCNGGVNDGSILYTMTGGTAPYAYNWSPNANSTADSATQLPAGTYDVTITDTKGCSITNSVTVSEPAQAFVLNSQGSTNSTCFQANNGTAFITVQGGTPNVSYTWTPNVSSSANAANLAPNTIQVIAADGNGCSVSATFNITEPSDILITPTQTDVKCNGEATGTISLTVTGGTPSQTGYNYTWTPNVSSGSSASGLNAGQYQIVVSDSLLCTKTQSLTISGPPAIQLTAQVTDEPCFNDSVGSITLTANGGAPAYSYEIEQNGTFIASANNQFNQLKAGSYNIRVTDANQCKTVSPFSLAEPAAIQVSFVTDTVKCFGESNGAIQAIATGGTPAYTYSIANGTSNQTGSWNALKAGNYSVIVSDAKGCSQTFSTAVPQPDSIEIYVSPTPPVELKLSDSKEVEVSSNYANAVFNWLPANGLSCSACANPTITIYNNTQYKITATVSPHGKECVNTLDLPVKVVKNYDMYLPNAFTPNGDGVNDVYEIFGNKRAIKYVEILIFNRWGELVFSSKDIDFKWDGRYKGVSVSPGIYPYDMNITFVDGHSERDYKGTLTVLR